MFKSGECISIDSYELTFRAITGESCTIRIGQGLKFNYNLSGPNNVTLSKKDMTFTISLTNFNNLFKVKETSEFLRARDSLIAEWADLSNLAPQYLDDGADYKTYLAVSERRVRLEAHLVQEFIDEVLTVN